VGRGKPAEKAKILERQNDAIELRKSGFTYREIARRLDIDVAQAYRDVQNELNVLRTEVAHNAEELRQLELERIDKITRAMDSWVEAGNTQAAIATLKASERRAKLLGLDKPTEIKVDIQLFLQLQHAADKVGVNLSEVFQAMINEFANVDPAGDSP
jgi:hypothetical protein